MPGVYRQCAVTYTDFWTAYATVLPSCRHQAVGKGTSLTSYIERFNNILGQRVCRLVRETLYFSKKLQNNTNLPAHSTVLTAYPHESAKRDS